MLSFIGRRKGEAERDSTSLAGFVSDYSIEVMPRTAEKIEDFRTLLPVGTRVYIAHIDGTPIEDMLATAKRLSRDGFEVMPHLPARICPGSAPMRQFRLNG